MKLNEPGRAEISKVNFPAALPVLSKRREITLLLIKNCPIDQLGALLIGNRSTDQESHY